MRKLFTLFLVSFFLTFLYSAVVLTSSGRVVADVLSIDKNGVTIRAKLGTTTFKPQDVKYVLLDESRTDLEGKVGIFLKNGAWVYGEPNQITSSSGLITSTYSTISTNLSNILYFSYSKPPTLEEFLKITQDHIPNILQSLDENTIVELSNGSKFIAKQMKIITDSSKTRFQFTDDFGTYTFDQSFIWCVNVAKTRAQNYNYIVETKKGTYILCNPKFSGENVILTLPFETNYILKYNQISAIGKVGSIIPTTQRQVLIRNEYQGIPTTFYYDPESKTLTITFIGETLSLDGKNVNEIVIEVPSK